MAAGSEQAEGQLLGTADYITIERMNRIAHESLIKEENLQKEIVDLNIKLEELKASYDKDVNKAKAELSKEKQRIQLAHQKELSLLQQSHDNYVIKLEEQHQKKMRAMMEKMALEAEELQQELAESRNLLESTKDELEREKEAQMEKLKGSMATAHKEQMELVTNRMLREQREEFEQTLDRVKRSHSQQLAVHEQQHQENIKAILERTGDIKEMEKQFAQAQDENKALEAELEILKGELKQTKQEKTMMEAKMLELQIELDDFRNRFEARVRQVELKYIDQIDGLRLENSQLRRKVLDLSVQISRYQTAVTSLKVQSRPSKSAMFKAVVQARLAANLSLAGDTALSGHAPQTPEPRPNSKARRPTSAPSTPKESEQARAAALATNHKKLGQEQQGKRPQSSITVSRLLRL